MSGRGAVVAEDVDLEFLRPGDLVELRGKGEAPFSDVVVSILPAMALATPFDAGAHILGSTVVEVVAKILVARGR